MKTIWLDQAAHDLRSLRTYIAADNPSAARQQVLRIVSATKNLTKFPNLGRVGRYAGTRELVIGKTPYIVMYRVKNKTIEILRVLHESRQWPEGF